MLSSVLGRRDAPDHREIDFIVIAMDSDDYTSTGPGENGCAGFRVRFCGRLSLAGVGSHGDATVPEQLERDPGRWHSGPYQGGRRPPIPGQDRGRRPPDNQYRVPACWRPGLDPRATAAHRDVACGADSPRPRKYPFALHSGEWVDLGRQKGGVRARRSCVNTRCMTGANGTCHGLRDTDGRGRVLSSIPHSRSGSQGAARVPGEAPRPVHAPKRSRRLRPPGRGTGGRDSSQPSVFFLCISTSIGPIPCCSRSSA
jgi:hypothetical protein